MIDRGGAMALFVLRLAGLLSVEKSFTDNSTTSAATQNNDTSALYESRNFAASPASTSNNISFLASFEPGYEDENQFAEAPKFSYLKLKHLPNDSSVLDNENLRNASQIATNTTPFLNHREKAIDQTGDSSGFIFNSRSVNKNVSNKLMHDTEASGDESDFKSTVSPSGPRDYHDEDIFDGGGFGGDSSSAEMINSGSAYGEEDYEQHLSNEAVLHTRNSHTGFSPVFTKPVDPSDVPYYGNVPSRTPPRLNATVIRGHNSSFRNSFNDKYQRLEVPVSDTVFTTYDYYDLGGNTSVYTPPALTSRSLISPIPRPGQETAYKEYVQSEKEKEKQQYLEEKITEEREEKYKDIKNEKQIEKNNYSKENENGHKERGSAKDNQRKKIEKKKNSKEIQHQLEKKDANNKNKEALVEWTGAAETIKNETENKIETENNAEKESQLTNNATTAEINNNRGSEISSAPPVRSNDTDLERNNPYPYGPKILPKESSSYIPKLPGSFGHLFPDSDFLSNYDYESVEHVIVEEQREKYFVRTEKPTVLFHFDKPGYSPKLPESFIPPTRAPTPGDPWSCSLRCPKYTLLDWNPDYDIRQYPVTTWISTVIIAHNRILAELEGYMRVQDYFYGLNDRGQLLNITVPFVTQIKHGRHPGVLKEVTDYSVSLYIHHEDDHLNYDLPTPISNEVLVDRLETKTVFVAGFEANVWEVTEVFLSERAEKLMEKLRQNGEAFLDRYFYLASYNRPELYQPVYYELWIYATAFRDTVHTQTPPIAPRRRPPPNDLTTKTVTRLCRGVECPPFEVLRTYRYGIQKRRYFDGLFATTSPGECEFTTLSVWKGFMPLHLYKHGINSHMEVIEATRPIALVHVKEDSTSFTECPQNMTMAIYLPKRLHSNPPLTGYDAPPVQVNALQDVVVYAYTVGGYLLEPDRVRKELADLKYRLTEFGACFKDDEYYIVVYDFIVRYHGRQNEIWVVAENCKATRNG